MTYKILTLDQAHNHAGADGRTPEIYKIEATSGIAIEAADGIIGPVNAVQVILGENAIYHCEWDGKTILALDAHNLVAIRADHAFNGFPNGQKVVIGIGELKQTDPNSDSAQFFVAYVLMIEVQ